MICRRRQSRKFRSLICRNRTGQAVAGVALLFVTSSLLAQSQPSSTTDALDAGLTNDIEGVAPGASAEPEGYIELGFGQTDNLNRNVEELQSDIGMIGVGFAGRTDRRRLRAALAGDIEYRKYGADELSDDDDDEVLGSVDGELELHAVPDRLQWNFGFGYGQVRIDPLGAVGPSNRQRTTSFSTGPRISLPLGERTLVQLEGVVSEQEFEVTEELDGRLTAVRVGLERQVDPVTQVTLVLDDSETEYDLDNEIYNIQTLSLEYRRELASGEAFASIGRGRVDVEDDSEPITVARLSWNRDVGARSNLEICYGREITDAGSAFANAGVAIGCPGELRDLASVVRTTGNREQGVVPTTSPFVRSGGSVSLTVEGESGGLRATFSMAQDRFEEQSTFDNDSTIVEVSGSRDFARRWRAELTARFWIQDFVERGEENEDRFIRFSLSRLLGRNMRLTLSYEKNRRVGGVGPFDANDYFLSFGRDFGR